VTEEHIDFVVEPADVEGARWLPFPFPNLQIAAFLGQVFRQQLLAATEMREIPFT